MKYVMIYICVYISYNIMTATGFFNCWHSPVQFICYLSIRSLYFNWSTLYYEVRNIHKCLLFFFNKILIIHNLLLFKIVLLPYWKDRQLTGHKLFPLGKGDVCLLVSFPYEYLPLPLAFTIKFTLLKSMENEVKSLEQQLHDGISKQ